MKFFSPEISRVLQPGQFLNIKVIESIHPLLRRPFSVSDVSGDFFSLLFTVCGEGTALLSRKQKNDKVNILGPLGNGFPLDGEYDHAVFAAGGIGIAPFPFLFRRLSASKKISAYIGARSHRDLISTGIPSFHAATDDGSFGFHGNVVDLLKHDLDLLKNSRTRIFACGPNPMLKALAKFAAAENIDCYISTESAMACGFGICQGCPMPSAHQSDSYLLVCKDGPVFSASDVVL